MDLLRERAAGPTRQLRLSDGTRESCRAVGAAVARAVAGARVLHRRRDGEGAVCGANGARDQAGAVRLLGGDLLGRLDRQLDADLVELVHHVLHVVVGLRRSQKQRNRE